MWVIVVWRNEDLGTGIAHRLEDAGSVVRAIERCRESGTFLDIVCSDIMIPSFNLPAPDGFPILRNIRVCGDSWPIFPLKVLSDVMVRVHKSDAVAKDGLNRPFALKELESRVRALVRRIASPLRSASISEGLRSDSTVHRTRRGFAHGQETRLPQRKMTRRRAPMRRQVSTATESAFLDHTPATGADVGESVIEKHLSTLRMADSPYGMSIRGQCWVGFYPATVRS